MDGEYCRSSGDVFVGARVRRGACDVAEESVRWAVPLPLAECVAMMGQDRTGQDTVLVDRGAWSVYELASRQGQHR